MSDNSAIEWTEATWNPVTGCRKVSPGCKNCYAERMARRLQAMGSPNYARGFDVSIHEHALSLPLEWTRPRNVFVNSMGDLLHKDVPTSFICRVFEVMRAASQHTFQILTKHSSRLGEVEKLIKWPTNVWMGVSVETADFAFRINQLRDTSATVKFISFEPLLGPMADLDLSGIDWVIAGGESGPGARPMHPDWARDIRDQALRANIPFFFKQWGGRNKKKAGRLLDGRTWDGMPRSSRLGRH